MPHRRAGGGDRCPAASADDGSRDRRDPGDGDLGRLGRAKENRPGRLSRLGAEEPIRRYERRRAGELIHIDVKKLGRIGPNGAGHRVLGRSWAKKAKARTDAAGVRRRQSGWDRVHVCVDDATRLAYAEVLPTRRRRP